MRRASHFLAVLAGKAIEVLTGISLPPECEIGPGLFIGHFGGIVVNARARIGRCCNLSHGVTIGSGGRGVEDGHQVEGVPTIGARVYIGPGACLFGRITIGDDVAVGANAVVTKSVPDRAVVVGVPAKVISFKGSFSYVQYRGMESDSDRNCALRMAEKERELEPEQHLSSEVVDEASGRNDVRT